MPVRVTCPTCGAELPPDAVSCPKDGTSVSAAIALAPTVLGDTMIGRQVGEYVVQRAIGGGGMGVVYEALQPLINRRVAIKILRPQIAGDPEHVQRLLAEARATNAIRHRGIIDIFGFGELQGTGHYVVMEYLEGYSLETQLVQRGVFAENDVLWILDEVLDALDSAHAASIVHRDMKPSNIFVVTGSKSGKYIKVLDFGLAKEMIPGPMTPQTFVGSIVGTPEYLSPEQAAAGKVGPKTDLYSLGVVAFELLTGKLPFQGGAPMETAMMHIHQPVPRVTSLRMDIDPVLDELLFQMMAKKPEDRPESAAAVRARVKHVRRFMMDSSTHVVAPRHRAEAAPRVAEVNPPEIRTSDVVLPPRRRLGWWLTGGAGALVGVALATWAVFHRSKPVDRAALDADARSAGAPARAGRTPEQPADSDEPTTSTEPEHTTAPTPERTRTGPRHAAKEPAPSRQQLLRRIDELERRVKRQASGAQPNPVLLAFLQNERQKVIEADEPTRRRSIAAYLTKWENKFLSSP